jgi:hypothetical protein
MWDVLGLAATKDRAEIRRAYAVRLKVTNPEDDPDGFQELRAAYERALAHAGGRGGPQVSFGPVIQASARVGRRGARVAKEAPVELSPSDTKPEPAREIEPEEGDQQRVAREAADAEVRHRALMEELHRALVAGETPSDALVAKLEDLLASRAMEAVETYDLTERWLAELIVRTKPRSDALVDRAIAHFKWTRDTRIDSQARRADFRPAVLARSDDLAFLQSFRRPGAQHYEAWRVLTRPITRRLSWMYRLSPSLAGEVKTLLMIIRTHQQSLLADLDPSASAWWDRYLAEPQLWPAFYWGVLLISLIAAAGAATRAVGGAQAVFFFLGSFIGYGALGFGLLFGTLYGFGRPRAWFRKKAPAAPAWLRFGWASASMLLTLAAAVIPASLWTTTPLVVAALATVYWAYVTGVLDTRTDVGEPWRMRVFLHPYAMAAFLAVTLLRPGLRYPWWFRTIFAFIFLGIFWWLVRQVMSYVQWVQLGLVGGCAVFCMSWGAWGLVELWRSWPERRRKAVLAGLGAAALLVLAALWTGLPRALEPLAIGLIATLVLAHKPMGVDVGEKRVLYRELAMRFGWLAWLIGIAAAQRLSPKGGDNLLLEGSWILTGVLVTASACINPPIRRQARRAAPELSSL